MIKNVFISIITLYTYINVIFMSFYYGSPTFYTLNVNIPDETSYLPKLENFNIVYIITNIMPNYNAKDNIIWIHINNSFFKVYLITINIYLTPFYKSYIKHDNENTATVIINNNIAII